MQEAQKSVKTCGKKTGGFGVTVNRLGKWRELINQ